MVDIEKVIEQSEENIRQALADYAAHTIMTHAFDYGSIRYEMGYACAICFVLFLVMLVVNNVIRKAMSGILDT